MVTISLNEYNELRDFKRQFEEKSENSTCVVDVYRSCFHDSYSRRYYTESQAVENLAKDLKKLHEDNALLDKENNALKTKLSNVKKMGLIKFWIWKRVN